MLHLVPLVVLKIYVLSFTQSFSLSANVNACEYECQCNVNALCSFFFSSTVIHSKFWWSLRSQKLHSFEFGKNHLVTSVFRSTLKELWFHHYLCTLKYLTDSKTQFRWITFTYLLFRLKLSTKWKNAYRIKIVEKNFWTCR